MIRTVANMKYGQNVADFLSAHLPADYSFNADALNTEGCSGNDNNAQGAVGKVYTGGECKVASRQGDQDTTKVKKRISRALSKVLATGFTHPPSSVGVACSGKPCLIMPRPHWMKPVAQTVRTTLDMRFPTFVVP